MSAAAGDTSLLDVATGKDGENGDKEDDGFFGSILQRACAHTLPTDIKEYCKLYSRRKDTVGATQPTHQSLEVPKYKREAGGVEAELTVHSRGCLSSHLLTFCSPVILES